MSTFVSVGNATQPFTRLLEGVAAIADRLPQPVIVQSGCGHVAAAGCDARAYVPMDEFERLVARADLLILHAGAGSVIHAIRAGKVPVVMPRRAPLGEHVDDHQVEFAAALERVGRAVVAHNASGLAEAVERALALQRQSRSVTRPSDLVRRVAERLEHYARRSA